MKFPTLYHKSKLGKIVEWEVETMAGDIFVTWGEVDGKKQKTFTTATTKNIGKKNEIDPISQAEIEAKAMWKHRVERKYSETIKDAQETVFLPMLAHEFEKCKKKIAYPVNVQPKLDGNRALAYWEEDKIVLMSRGGKTWDVPHIEEAIAKILPKDMVLDGEIYKHGLNLQGINKLVKKHRDGPDGTLSLKFYAFDCFYLEEEKTWLLRYEDLLDLNLDDEVLMRVSSDIAEDEDDVKKLAAEYIEEGYEGAIIRKLDGLYKLGERSRDLLKLKNFQDAEFKVVDTYLGKGKHEGCMGFVCNTKEGLPFHCYPRGTLDQKREWGTRREDFVGEWLKVRFQFYTDEGIPFLPIGICIRDRKDIG